MTYSPPPDYNTIAYQGALPVASPRPTSVSVIAILAIIFGAIGAICTPLSQLSVLFNLGSFVPNRVDPVGDAIRGDAVLYAMTVLSTVVGTLVGIGMLSGGIGAWRMKEWGRRTLLTVAIVGIVMNVCNTIVQMVFLLPKLNDLASSAAPAIKASISLMPYLTIGLFLLGLVLPVCFLYFLTRPHVKAAFAAAGAPFGPAAPAPAPAPTQWMDPR